MALYLEEFVMFMVEVTVVGIQISKSKIVAVILYISCQVHQLAHCVIVLPATIMVNNEFCYNSKKVSVKNVGFAMES